MKSKSATLEDVARHAGVSYQTVSRVLNKSAKESANKQVISSQADSLIKISRIWADFFPANTSNQPI
ncbi:LacI family DNA-binding transcriptional regulator, partial [Klebsiella pneumoniae]|uniref:LacI family DNA-binding transcriptional regulator n=1 Tax=Klebsiella pneumoniae TaxID=573 RepID=UPI003F02BE15